MWAVVIVLAVCVIAIPVLLAGTLLARRWLLLLGLVLGVIARGSALALLASESATFVGDQDSARGSGCDPGPTSFRLLHFLCSIPLGAFIAEAVFVAARSGAGR